MDLGGRGVGGALAPADPPGPGVSDPGDLGGGGGANSRAQENVFGWAGWVAWGICILVYVCVYINIYICIPVSKLHTGSTPEVLFVPPRAGMLAIGDMIVMKPLWAGARGPPPGARG